jgi:hypothetical protein
VTAFPGPNLDESRGLQLADHLGPGQVDIVNLPLGFVNATNCWWGSMRVRFPAYGRTRDRLEVLDAAGL